MKVTQNLEATKKDQEEYGETKITMIETAVKERKQEIDRVLEGYHQKITNTQDKWND